MQLLGWRRSFLNTNLILEPYFLEKIASMVYFAMLNFGCFGLGLNYLPYPSRLYGTLIHVTTGSASNSRLILGNGETHSGTRGSATGCRGNYSIYIIIYIYWKTGWKRQNVWPMAFLFVFKQSGFRLVVIPDRYQIDSTCVFKASLKSTHLKPHLAGWVDPCARWN